VGIDGDGNMLYLDLTVWLFLNHKKSMLEIEIKFSFTNIIYSNIDFP
jgi:hypothetical protein